MVCKRKDGGHVGAEYDLYQERTKAHAQDVATLLPVAVVGGKCLHTSAHGRYYLSEQSSARLSPFLGCSSRNLDQTSVCCQSEDWQWAVLAKIWRKQKSECSLRIARASTRACWRMH